MSTRKRLKLGLLGVARALGLFALARRLTAGTVKILCYHYVSLDDEETRFPTLFITPESFRRRLEHLRRHYRVITFDQAVTALAEGTSGRGRVAITFDDGHYDFYAAAAPALREHGMPATMYVLTGHIDTGTPFNLMLLRDIIARTEVEEFAAPLPELPLSGSLSDLGVRADFERRAIREICLLPPSSIERLEFARRVGRALEVDVDAILERRTWDVMTAEEIRELSDEGFDMQLHGHGHRNVVRYLDEVFDEVTTCQRRLAEITGKEARDFCYPSGMWTRDAWQALERAGIRTATTTRFGPNSPETPPLALRRYLDAESLTQLEFEFELSGLRWLLFALRHPGRRWVPSEKLEGYEASPTLF